MSFLSAFFSFIPTLIGVLGDLPKAISALEGLDKLIKDAEATGVDGPTKLASVLNDFQVILNDLNPQLGSDFSAIAKEVEDFVNAVVSFYNEFAHAAPATPAA